MRASALANRATTVPEGTLIAAVLETGFDSTQPGFARAVVSRDVRSFDGANVLIPRGSKLIGEYRSDVAHGQKRAVIIWTRLIRPDGMTIAMDSPAVDTTGRGGVPASVNNHFLERFGDALLQTTGHRKRLCSALGWPGRSLIRQYVHGSAAARAAWQLRSDSDCPGWEEHQRVCRA
jgi:type IV secretory pathway VirB10-like protein